MIAAPLQTPLAGDTNFGAKRPQQQVRLQLLKGFQLSVAGQPVLLPAGGERLLALLALSERPLKRSAAAGILWGDVNGERASGNLRTAIWRMLRVGVDLVERHGYTLSLARDVVVDVLELTDQAKRLFNGDTCVDSDYDCSPLAGDLLPLWDDDWVVIERERLRQLRLHALERLCVRLATQGRFLEAIAAGLAAVQAEPLRESGHRALISAHIAEGNWSEAMTQYRFFRKMLWDELRLEPSQHIERLVEPLTCR